MNRRRFPYGAALGAVAVGSLLLVAALSCAPSGSAHHGASNDVTARGPDAVIVAVADPIGPTDENHGVPVGWRHDRHGAEAASAAYVEASGLVATDGPLARRDVVLALATPDYGPSLVDSTNRELDDLFFSMGERGLNRADLIWSEHALTLHSTVRSDNEIEVQVWSVLVLAARGGSVSRQIWRTSTLDLRWVNDDWKVDRWSTDPGPLPAPPAEIDTASVTAIAEVTSWSPARSGGDS